MPSTASFWNLFQTELRVFKGVMSAMGRARFEAEQGEHDDLVMAVAQAVWWGESRPKPQPRLVLPKIDKIAPSWKIPGYGSQIPFAPH